MTLTVQDQVSVWPPVTPAALLSVIASETGGSFAADMNSAKGLLVTLDADLAMAAPANVGLLAAGNVFWVYVEQDPTGYHLLTWNAAWGLGARYMPRQGANQLSAFAFVALGNGAFQPLEVSAIDLQAEKILLTDWGIVGDGTTRNGAALRKAVAWAESVNNLPGMVELHFPASSNYYVIDGDILVRGTLKVSGAGALATSIITDSAAPACGFLVQQSADPAHMPLIDPLVGSLGKSLHVTNADWCTGPARWLNLATLTNHLNLDGLSAFNMRYFLKITGSIAPGFENAFMINMTDVGQSTNSEECINIIATSTQFQMSFTTTAGTVTLPITYPTDGAVHHYEIDYDGSELRWFVDGTVSNSVACTGTIVNPTCNGWYIGTVMKGSLAVDVELGPIDFDMYSLQISRVSRNTSNFTPPTTAHTNDNNTYCLMNCDVVDGQYIFNEGGAYGAQRWASMIEGNLTYLAPASTGLATAYLDLSDLTMDNFYTCVLLNTAQNAQVIGCNLNGAKNSILVGGGGNSTKIRDGFYSTGNGFGVAYYAAAGAHELSAVQIASSGGAPGPGVFIGGTDTVWIRNMYLPHGLFNLALYNAKSIVCEGCYFSTEQQAADSTNACVSVSQSDVAFIGCDFDTEFNELNSIQVLGASNVTVDHPFFSGFFNIEFCGYAPGISSEQGAKVVIRSPQPFVQPDKRNYFVAPYGSDQFILEEMIAPVSVASTLTSNTLTPDFVNVERQVVTLDHNLTVANPSKNSSKWRSVIIDLIQDATGSRTVSWGTVYVVTGSLKSAANSLTRFEFLWDGTAMQQVN